MEEEGDFMGGEPGDVVFDGEDPDYIVEPKTSEFFDNLSLDSPLSSRNLLKAVTGGKLRDSESADVECMELKTETKRFRWHINIHNVIGLLYNLLYDCPKQSGVLVAKAYQDARKMIKHGPGRDLDIPDEKFVLSDYSYRLTYLSDWFDHANVIRARQNFTLKTNQHEGDRLEKRVLQSKKDMNGNRDNMLEVLFGQEFILMICQNQKILVDHKGFLMIADVIRSRRNAALYIELMNKQPGEQRINLSTVISLWNWGDSITKIAGNEGFSIIKLWEPLINGRLNVLSSWDILDREEFYNEMLKEYRTECLMKGVEKEGEVLIDIIESEKSPDVLAEYHGLAKTFGHPFVFVEMAIAKNKSMSMPPKRIDQKIMIGVLSELNRGIAEGHFRKTKSWPRCDLSYLQSPPSRYRNMPSKKKLYNSSSEYDRLKKSPILTAIRNNAPVDTMAKEYDREDWALVRFLKNDDSYKTMNLMDILKDKSSSPTLSQLKNSIRTRKKVDWKTKRVLSNFLFNNYPHPREFLEQVDREGLSLEDLLIGLAPKEREMNIVPRLFSIMPMRLKMFFGLTEELIANVFVPFFEECTMKDDLTELTGKFIKNVVATSSNQRYVLVYFSLDFIKWNLTFRRGNTEPFFESLDDYLGFSNLIRRTHQIFERIRFYFDDYDNHLQLDENEEIKDSYYTWTGQGGGCEGLRQKGWTLITICALRYALNKFFGKVDFSILGQGDNQVICLRILCPRGKIRSNLENEDKTYIRNLVEEIMKEIERISVGLGLPIKASETWRSLSLFNYGKNLFFDGRPLSMSIKKILRVFPYSNEEYPTMASALTSISAACMSAAAQKCTPVVPYLFQVIRCYEVIEHHTDLGVLSPKGLMTHADMRSGIRNMFIVGAKHFCDSMSRHRSLRPTDYNFALSLGCNLLGGSTLTSCWEYFLRGSPDPLTLQVSYLYSLATSPLLSKRELQIVQNLLDPVLDPEGTIENILEDPVSINIIAGRSTVGNLKRKTRTVLGSDLVVNRIIKEVLNLGIRQEDEIDKFLLTVKPFISTAIADFKKGTLSGFVKSIEGRVDHTRTVVQFYREQGESLVDTMKKCDLDTIFGWLYQLSKQGDNVMDRCPTLYSKRLRDSSWRMVARDQTFSVEGITYPCAFHLFSSFDVQLECLNCMEDDTRVELIFTKDSSENVNLLTTELGPNRPNTGSGTKEKIAIKAYETHNTPFCMSFANSNLRLINWIIEPHSNLANFLEKTFHSYTDGNPSYFESKEGYATGGAEHRLDTSSVKKQGILPTNLTPATHCLSNTNTMGMYSRGSGNYPLHFQSIIINHMLMNVCRRISRQIPCKREVHLHINCYECLKEASPILMDSTQEAPEVDVLPSTSPYFIRSEDLDKLVNSKFEFEHNILKEDILNSSVNSEDKDSLRIALIARSCAEAIMVEEPSRMRIPASWFMGTDLKRLFEQIKHECVKLHLAEQLSQDIVGSVKRTYKVDENRLRREVSQRIKNKEDMIFSSLENLFKVEENLNYASSIVQLSNLVPKNSPPRSDEIVHFIKNICLVGWDPIRKDCDTYLVDELTSGKSFLRLTSHILLSSTSEEQLHNGGLTYIREMNRRVQKLLTKTSATKYKIEDLIDVLQDVNLWSSENEHYKLYVESAMRMRSLYDLWFKKKFQYCDASKDYMIKELRSDYWSVPNPRSESRLSDSYKEIYVEVGEYRQTEYLRDHIGIKKHRIGGDSRILSTKKGAILYSMLKDLPIRDEIHFVADGSGGTSLAVSLVYPQTRCRIFPYLPPNMYPEAKAALPPDIARFNGDARVEKEKVSIDILESFSSNILENRVKDSCILDLDAIGEDAYYWILNFTNGLIGKQCYMLVSGYEDDVVELIVGWLSTVSNVQVRQSMIKHTWAFLLIYVPQSKLDERRACRSRLMTYDTDKYNPHLEMVDYDKVETAMIPYRSRILREIGNTYSMFKEGTDEAHLLIKMTRNLEVFYRSPLLEKTSRSYSRDELKNNNVIDIMIFLQVLCQCGVDRPVSFDRKGLVLKSSKEDHVQDRQQRSNLECFIVEGDRAFLHNQRIPGIKFRVPHVDEDSKKLKDTITRIKTFCASFENNHMTCNGGPMCTKYHSIKLLRDNFRRNRCNFTWNPLA